MTCRSCGTPLPQGIPFCPSCKKPTPYAANGWDGSWVTDQPATQARSEQTAPPAFSPLRRRVRLAPDNEQLASPRPAASPAGQSSDYQPFGSQPFGNRPFSSASEDKAAGIPSFPGYRPAEPSAPASTTGHPASSSFPWPEEFTFPVRKENGISPWSDAAGSQGSSHPSLAPGAVPPFSSSLSPRQEGTSTVSNASPSQLTSFTGFSAGPSFSQPPSFQDAPGAASLPGIGAAPGPSGYSNPLAGQGSRQVTESGNMPFPASPFAPASNSLPGVGLSERASLFPTGQNMPISAPADQTLQTARLPRRASAAFEGDQSLSSPQQVSPTWQAELYTGEERFAAHPARKRPSSFVLIGILVIILVLLSGAGTWVLVLFNRTTNSAPPATTRSTPATHATGAAATTPGATGTAVSTATATAITVTTGPSGKTVVPAAAAIISNVKSSSAIDKDYQPTRVTASFAPGQTVYVTFTIDSKKQAGYIHIKWYGDNRLLADDQLTHDPQNNVAYFGISYDKAMSGAAELYWCTQASCNDAQLAQVVKFTVTGAATVSPGKQLAASTISPSHHARRA
ncbi:MAG: hypothetical protein IMW89_03810 [Ktedonobacteraceae bacterium]|nr:hypothetical protein [Ktedonobacteraceae bacterium]